MEASCLVIALLLLLGIIYVPVIPGVLLLWHIVALLRAYERRWLTAVLLWLGVFLGTTVWSLASPAERREGHGGISGLPFVTEPGEVRWQRFLIVQTGLNLVGALGLTVALRLAEKATEQDDTTSEG